MNMITSIFVPLQHAVAAGSDFNTLTMLTADRTGLDVGDWLLIQGSAVRLSVAQMKDYPCSDKLSSAPEICS